MKVDGRTKKYDYETGKLISIKPPSVPTLYCERCGKKIHYYLQIISFNVPFLYVCEECEEELRSTYALDESWTYEDR